VPRLSVGAKWALRYAVVTFVTISLLGLYVYQRVERRIVRDAELIAQIPLRNVREAMKRYPGDRARWAEVIDREVSAADGDLRLGIQLFDEGGRLLLARGSFEQRPIPLPRGVLDGSRAARSWELELDELSSGRRFYVMSAKAPEGYLQTAVYSRRFDRHIAFIADGFFVAIPIALVVTVGLGWLLARVSLRPIKRINATAQRISVTNLDAAVPTTGSGDELDQLASTLNGMLERIRASVGRIRRFYADAAHELRTPLAAIRSQIEVTLEKARTHEEYERVLGQLLHEVDRLAAGADAMLRLAQSEAGLDPEMSGELDIGQLLAEVVDFFDPLAAEADVKLELHVDDGMTPVVGDAGWLHQLFANLVHNAVKFTPAGGSISVVAKAGRDSAGAVVEVHDTGVGIQPDRLPGIFERFSKEDASRSEEGFGLGLSLAREIARAHGGSIAVESEAGVGSTFRVTLPVGQRPDA
jgi:two-component system heavy metal sensor histidine kinase CusS